MKTRKRWGRPQNKALGFTLGLILLVGAIWFVFHQHDILLKALDHASNAPAWLLLLAVVLPVANWLLISLSFWVLTSRHGPVHLKEMNALIGSAWLLNYLPMRPGLIGRVAYHKKYHHIALRTSARILFENVSTSGLCAALLVVSLAFTQSINSLHWFSVLMLPMALLSLISLSLLSLPRHTRFLHYSINSVIRYADLLLWVARYWVVFSIVGEPITPLVAVAVALASQLAMLVPLVGNGLGLREWSIGLAAALVPQAASVLGNHSAISSQDAALGAMAADLVNRAAELLIALPVGFLCIARLSKYRLKQSR